jgi:alanine racemase
MTEDIFILAGLLPEFAETILQYRLTPVLVDTHSLDALDSAARSQGCILNVHLKMDAGMGRQGVLPVDFATAVQEVRQRTNLNLAGIMAHFPMADDPDSGSTATVLEEFLAVNRSCGHDPGGPCLHIANSGGIFSVAAAALDMVRPGISLYGYGAAPVTPSSSGPERALRPAMSFLSRVIGVRVVPAGTGLGYGHSFVTRRRTRLAVLPVGYEDGYLRTLSNRGRVLIRGRRAPVLGRVSMNLTLVDVTDIPGVETGDEAVLLGRQGQECITADEIAAWMGTISYEVLCLFGHCNRVEYVD